MVQMKQRGNMVNSEYVDYYSGWNGVRRCYMKMFYVDGI